MPISKLLFCATLMISLTMTRIGESQTPALDFSSLSGGFDYYQGQYSLGWRFTANQNIKVTALGFYDDKQDGIITSHPVGIFDQQTCQLLASTTVEPGDPLV